jgi:hypothetical protein
LLQDKNRIARTAEQVSVGSEITLDDWTTTSRKTTERNRLGKIATDKTPIMAAAMMTTTTTRRQSKPKSFTMTNTTLETNNTDVTTTTTTPADDNAKNNKKERKKVSFSMVDVRHCERILSDNPSPVSGPPIGIGWRYNQETMSVDDWERRQAERRMKRSQSSFYYQDSTAAAAAATSCLILDREQREELLLSLGYTEEEIADAVRRTIRDKNRRRQTVHNLKAQGLEEALESVRGGVKRLLFRKKKVQKVQHERNRAIL